MTVQAKEIFLKEYTRPYYWIKNVSLDFDIYNEKTTVVSELSLERNAEHKGSHDLELDGVDLKLLSIKINNVELDKDHYEVKGEKLFVKTDEDVFTLTTTVEIDPNKNNIF